MLVENFMTYVQYLNFCGFVYTLLMCTDCLFTVFHSQWKTVNEQSVHKQCVNKCMYMCMYVYLC